MLAWEAIITKIKTMLAWKAIITTFKTIKLQNKNYVSMECNNYNLQNLQTPQ